MNDYPNSATYELAGFGNRLVAYVIDFIILSIIRFVVLVFLGDFLTTVASLLILNLAATGIYNWYFWTRQAGQSPGKKAMNIRVIKADGSPITDVDALVRTLGYFVGEVTLFLGFVWAAFDANNQAWHDKMANTYVVLTEAQNKTITL